MDVKSRKLKKIDVVTYNQPGEVNRIGGRGHWD
jgi:hypothetical protein